MFAAKHAAIIGIDDYGSGIAALKSAVADARAIAGALGRDHGFAAPHLLLDGEATGPAILRLLEEELPTAAAAAGSDAAVVLYFAGHGVALGDGSEGPEGFLLPQDARAGDESTWLPMRRVRAALGRLPCRHLLVVLDCCFAGSFRWAASRSFVPVGRPLYDSQYQRFIRGTAWQVLTSASHQERALDVSPGCRNTRDAVADGHSPFAAALLRGLAGAADSSRGSHAADGVITATELHQYIFEEFVPRDGRSWQTPGIWPLKSENTGEFVFVAPGREVQTRPDPPLDDANNPWLGLQAYGRKDAGLFFGRERVVEEVLGRLLDPARSPFLAVVGASGTGKSSVLRAGVLPRLEQPPEELAARTGPWTVARMPRLQGDPRQQLDEVLATLAASPAGRRQLLYIDQFEELYTQCPDGEVRAAFLRRLHELGRGDAPVALVLTLRSDFEPRLAASEELGPLLAANRYLVPAMTSEEYRDVIEEPAKAKALYFEPPALVGELVDEVMAMPGGLPLLSFALSEMYRQAQLRRRATGALDRALTRADYTATGGVVGALHRRANELYEAEDAPHRETIRRLFLRLVAQEGGRLARRRVERRELDYADPAEQERVQRVLADYVQARLLVADEDHVEPAHDTLVLAWEKLLDWLAASGSQELLRQLWGAASAWEAARREKGEKRAVGLLWNQDPRLPLIQTGDLNRLEREFAGRSATRKRHRRNLVAGITAGVVLALSAATWFSTTKAFDERKARGEAEERRKEAEAATARAQEEQEKAERAALAERVAKEEAEAATAAERAARQRAQDTARVAVAGELIAKRDATRAALTLLEVAKPDATAYAAARLREVLGTLSEAVLRGHQSAVVSADFSPDGRRIVTASEDGTARVWGADGSGKAVVVAKNPTEKGFGHLVGAVFSPVDANRVLTVSFKGRAQVWVADGSLAHVTLAEPGEVWEHAWFNEKRVTSAAFSPDGKLVVTGYWNGEVRLWPADRSAASTLLGRHALAVGSVAFSPCGDLVVSASHDRTAAVWDVFKDPREVFRFTGHTDGVRSATFSRNCEEFMSVVTASFDKTAQVWSPSGWGGAAVLGPHPHEDRVLSASFSPDRRFVVTASLDRTAQIWAATGGSGGYRQPLRGHQGPVVAAAFSPDGRRVVTASEDGTARVWDASYGVEQAVVLHGHRGPLVSAVFSPDGSRVVTASRDGTARVWSANFFGEPVVLPIAYGVRADFSPDGRRIVTSPSGRGGPIETRLRASSPDGKRVVTGSDDGTAVVSAADGSGEPLVLQGHKARVDRVAFSPDGQRVLTLSADRTARLWAVGGSLLQTLVRAATAECLEPEFRRNQLGETPAEAAAASARCRRCIGPWRRRFDARSVRAAPDKAWGVWQQCISQ